MKTILTRHIGTCILSLAAVCGSQSCSLPSRIGMVTGLVRKSSIPDSMQRSDSPFMAAAYRFVGGSYARHYGAGLQGSGEAPFQPHPDDIAHLATVSNFDANQVLIEALALASGTRRPSDGTATPVNVSLGRPAGAVAGTGTTAGS